VINWSCLAPFLRYGDLLVENCIFFIPLSYSVPPLPIFPLEFHREVKRQETRVMGLLCDEGCVILIQPLWLIHPCDGQTDRQTDGRWHIARYSIYAVARLKHTVNSKHLKTDEPINLKLPPPAKNCSCFQPVATPRKDAFYFEVA